MNKKKHTICHVTTVHNLHDTRIYYKEIMSLVNSGFLVSFIVQKNDGYLKNDTITYYFLSDRSGLFTRFSNNIKALIYSFKIKAEIYHLHDPELLPLGILIKILLRKKIIYDIHELYHDAILHKHYFPKYVAKISSKIYSIIEKFSIRFFDSIILAELNYSKHYSKYEHEIIQNYFPEKYILKNLKLINPNEQPLKIIYVGGITKIRGIYELLNFLKLLKKHLEFEFHLIGPIYPDSIRKDIDSFINENTLKGNVIIYNRIPYTIALNIMESCDVGLLFLHPIINNTTILSTKMFEYMAKGLVVLMSDFPLWVEFNSQYNCGLTINIFDIDNQIEAIIDYFKNTEVLNKIKSNNVKLIKENFRWEIEEKKLLNLYNKILTS